MKQLLAWIAALFSRKRTPPVIVKPPPVKPPPVHQFTWPDKRPIGMVMLANYKEYNGTPNFMNGQMPLSEWLIQHADNCLGNTSGYQGIIVWDPEGQNTPRPYTYIGDPKYAPPEVDLFFSVIKRAGLRTGVCIRPDLTEFWGGWPHHLVVASAFDNLVHKVEYAHNRWGCTLFYVDSNIGHELPVGSDNTVGAGDMMPAKIFAELHKLFPDFLFIPEHNNAEYDVCCAPFWHKGRENNMREGSTTVIDCSDTIWTQEQLTTAVKDGHILMGRVWHPTHELPLIKKSYIY